MNLTEEIHWLTELIQHGKEPIIPYVWKKTDTKLGLRIIEVLVKVQDKGIRRKKAEQPKHESFKEFITAYDGFIRARQNGIGCLIDGIQAGALNKIITYLVASSKEKSEAGALASFQYILANWERLNPFLRQQVALYSIYKNLPEILEALKNGNYKTNKPAAELANLKSQLSK